MCRECHVFTPDRFKTLVSNLHSACPKIDFIKAAIDVRYKYRDDKSYGHAWQKLLPLYYKCLKYGDQMPYLLLLELLAACMSARFSSELKPDDIMDSIPISGEYRVSLPLVGRVQSAINTCYQGKEEPGLLKDCWDLLVALNWYCSEFQGKIQDAAVIWLSLAELAELVKDHRAGSVTPSLGPQMVSPDDVCSCEAGTTEIQIFQCNHGGTINITITH